MTHSDRTADGTRSLCIVSDSPDWLEAHSTGFPIFFSSSPDFGFYILLLLVCFPRRAWVLFIYLFVCFKEYGCSKTERIQKWLGALSNALLKIHYKDE